ncbi:MAG: ROK family protein [Mangrovibacterium sp.]
MNASIGIDIGGTNTAIGIISEEGKVLAKSNIKTPKHGNAPKYVEELAEAINDLIKEKGANLNIIGIGIGAPNGNYNLGTIEYPANLSFQGVTPLVDLLKAQFPKYVHIALTNDANAAAIGEMIYGGARKMKNFLMYTLGTGVGGGIVVDGKLVYGHSGFAGENGHVMLFPGGRKCGCGQCGHLEAYCSAPGMARTALEIIARDNATDSPLAEIPFNRMESKDIYKAAIQGDAVALEVFEKTGEYLGMGLADAVHIFSPEAIFLFGGPTAAGDYILNPTKASMEKHLMTVFKDTVAIKISELEQNDAAIVGASALVMQEIKRS